MNIKNKSTDFLCRQFITHSYLYYKLSHSVISDYDFDKLARELYNRYDDISEYYKEFIDKESLTCGSGYAIPWHKVPERVKAVAQILRSGKDFSGNDIKIEEWIR